jgi:hypothetical protein
MGEIAEVQLLQLFLEVNADIDTQFQVWISITFAVLVASFVAGDRLRRGARFGLALLYACAAWVLFIRYLRAGTYLDYVVGLYELYGVVPPSQVGISATAGVLRTTLFTFGTAVAALSVLFPRMGHHREAAAPTPEGED